MLAQNERCSSIGGRVGVKLKKDVEALLTWAYRDELPKQSVGGLTGWERLTFLGTSVDESEREYSLPVALGPPHPDALLIDYVVKSLEDVRFKWADLRGRLMGHLAPYTPIDDPLCAGMKFESAALVRMHALMGTRPEWDVGPVTLTRIREKNGKPRVQYLDDEGHLTDGLTAGKRYGPMARCPLRLEPPGPEIACARAEYLVWRVGLLQIWSELSRVGLSEHHVLPPAAAELPWRRDTEHKGKLIVQPGGERNPSALPLKPQRPKALPPLRSEIEEQARSWRMAPKLIKEPR